MSAEPLFNLQGVWHTYAGAQPIAALRGIELQIYPGEYVAIIGANGSGKSTLARHLNALLLPSQGQAWAAGIPTSDATRRAALRRAVQMVFQEPDSQIVATTVEEDVAFGPENFGVDEARLPEQVRAALETVGMWEQRSRPPHMLSAGQKQRVAIAGALAVRPSALILDEATSMLDPAGRSAVLELLHALHSQGMTIVTITHEMDEAARASRVIALHQGQIAMDGLPREVFSRGTELREMGLDLPALANLAQRLGLPVCLTTGEIMAALGSPRSANPAPAPIQARATQPNTPPGNGNPVIHVDGLHHTYLRGTPLAVTALRGVDLQVARHARVGLVGPTGSGKSTLLQHLNGLMRPQQGHVWINALDWADRAIDAKAARQQVGLLFQQPEDQLFERYVGDDVAFGPRQMRLEHAQVRQRVQEAMEAVGLPFEAFKDRLTQTLSGGEKRRAALAGVLALQPQVLAADEATAGLDPRGRAEVLGIFQRINQSGVTVIFSSHRMEDVAALCDEVIAMQDGQVAATGPLYELFARTGMPQHPLAELVGELRAAGWPLPAGALTVTEIAAALSAVGAGNG